MDNDIEMMVLVRDSFVGQRNARDDSRQHEEILFDRRFECVCRPMEVLEYMDLDNEDLIEL